MRLALPLAWLTCTLLVFPFHWPMLIWIAGAVVCGRILTPRVTPRGRRLRLSLVLEVGMICGILAFSNMRGDWGWAVLPIGALMGLTCSILWTAVVLAAEWVPARHRSLLDGVAIRRAWITAALVSLGLVKGWRWLDPKMVHDHLALLLDLAMVALCVALDLWRFSSLRRWRGDLGVGDSSVELASEGSPYRQEPRVISSVRGDVAHTRQLFLRELWFDALAVVLAGAALAL